MLKKGRYLHDFFLSPQQILLPYYKFFRKMPMKTKELANEITSILEEKLQQNVHDTKKMKKAIAKESEKLAKKISKLNRKEIRGKKDPSNKTMQSSKKGEKLPSKLIPQN